MAEIETSISGVLERTYQNTYDLLKFAETKNTTLIAFNGGIIVGLAALLKDIKTPVLSYYMMYVIAMCVISIFISFSSLIAKMKHKVHDVSLTRSDNILYFGCIALLNDEELVMKIKQLYNLEIVNSTYERDLAKQLVITSQITARKFKLFNFAIRIMFFGLLTPLSIIVYYVFLNHDN
jgi:hypothetical protein